ncbi:hypothetical protein [Pseudoduganella sp. R-34]|jgi:hypothetical protein|uniref:hypothetical protein n=1 Tax=Pseudoduganella sp. R-34 TaxID=3404062 RepID=UPI003CF906E9
MKYIKTLKSLVHMLAHLVEKCQRNQLGAGLAIALVSMVPLSIAVMALAAGK